LNENITVDGSTGTGIRGLAAPIAGCVVQGLTISPKGPTVFSHVATGVGVMAVQQAGVDFTIVTSSFYPCRSQKSKKTIMTLDCLFLLLGSAQNKAAQKMQESISPTFFCARFSYKRLFF
jgi:hypothetical protein